MIENGDDAKLFMQMENALVCEKNPSVAIAMSNTIKETFPEYDFAHHTTLIKTISQNYQCGVI